MARAEKWAISLVFVNAALAAQYSNNPYEPSKTRPEKCNNLHKKLSDMARFIDVPCR